MSGSSFRSIAFICLASLTFSMCAGSESGPTSPTPTTPPAQQPPQPPPPPAAAKASVNITVEPNPVPHSGQAITDAAGCANVKFTWFYDQKLTETGGAAVTFTNRVDSFDGRDINNLTNLNVNVSSMGTQSVRTRWCSSNNAEHTAQTRWSGIDANGNPITVTGPLVRLSKP